MVILKNLTAGHYDYYLEGKGNVLYHPNNIELPRFAEPNSDLKCAISLYETIPDIRLEEANDPRLWSYLSLYCYRDYCISRGSYGADARKDTIKENMFFTGTSARTNVSNHISRLWWAVHMTLDANENDKYIYTKKIFFQMNK